MGSLSLLQQIFPTQESNWGLLHCRWILYQLSYQGIPSLIRLSPSSNTSCKYWFSRLTTLLTCLLFGGPDNLLTRFNSSVMVQELRKIHCLLLVYLLCIYYYWFVMKDANEQSCEKVYKLRFRRVLSTGTSVPMDFEVHHFPFQKRAYGSSPLFRVFMELLLCR